MFDFLADTWIKLLSETIEVAWLWLPLALGYAFYVIFYQWLQLRWTNVFWKSEMIEIKLPKDVTRSPKAMELALTALHIISPGLTYNLWFEGSMRPASSLEICSFGGDVHFFIRYPVKWKHMLMSQIYAHYPDVEITDVEDYTAKIPYGLPGSDWKLWGGIYELAKEDAYPIRTYVDLGLDKDPKEEFKVDPMVPILEYLGQLGPDEQVWIQFPIIAVKAKEWQPACEELLKKLSKRDIPLDAPLNFAQQSNTPGERATLEMIERSLGKLAFNTGIRVLYMTRKNSFKIPNVIPFLGIFRSVNSEGGNSIAFKQSSTYDQPWEMAGLREPALRAKFWREYRYRAWHYYPFKRKPMVFTTEELATLYHFPGAVASTPNLTRIGSKKAEAPMNLPI